MRDILIVEYAPTEEGGGTGGHDWFNEDREADALKRYIEWQAEAMLNGDQEVTMYRATVGDPDDDSFSSMNIDNWITDHGGIEYLTKTVVYRYSPGGEHKPSPWTQWRYKLASNHPSDNGHTLSTDRLEDGWEEISVTFYHGHEDGKPVVQIDTDGRCDFRINVNDGAVWDQSPEETYRLTDDLKRGK